MRVSASAVIYDGSLAEYRGRVGCAVPRGDGRYDVFLRTLGRPNYQDVLRGAREGSLQFGELTVDPRLGATCCCWSGAHANCGVAA